MSGETYLVTGGAGFVGGHLMRRLLADRPDARVVSAGQLLHRYGGEPRRRSAGDLPRRQHRRHREDLGELGGSTRRRSSSTWASTPGSCSPSTSSTRPGSSTCTAPRRSSASPRRTGAKLVYAGSSSKFGNDGQDEHLNPYAWTKAKNVEYIRNFSNWYGLDYVITYFYNVYGPGQIREGSYATVIGIFEEQYERGVPLTVVSPGTQTRDFTHIDDIVDGIVICADRG